MERILAAGADRVAVGCGWGEQEVICRELSAHFGEQAVIAAIDYTRGGKVFGHVYGDGMAVDVCDRLGRLACGEVMLTCVDNEGKMQGLDSALSCYPSSGKSVIVHGGVGKPEDVHAALIANAIGVGSMFQFTQYTPNDVKRYLKQYVEVRL